MCLRSGAKVSLVDYSYTNAKFSTVNTCRATPETSGSHGGRGGGADSARHAARLRRVLAGHGAADVGGQVHHQSQELVGAHPGSLHGTQACRRTIITRSPGEHGHDIGFGVLQPALWRGSRPEAFEITHTKARHWRPCTASCSILTRTSCGDSVASPACSCTTAIALLSSLTGIVPVSASQRPKRTMWQAAGKTAEAAALQQSRARQHTSTSRKMPNLLVLHI